MGRRLRLAFMGTPDFAVPSLDALLEAGHEIAAVYTQPPRPTGRGHRTQPSPVQARAEALGIPVHHPATLRDETEQKSFAALDLDAAIVAAYGLILPKAILAAPRLGCLNIHASLLPRWRGAAPIHRALLAGDAETGVTIMQMEAGLDTGPMLLRESLPIGPDTTAQSLHDALSALGARLIGPALDGVAAGTIRAAAAAGGRHHLRGKAQPRRRRAGLARRCLSERAKNPCAQPLSRRVVRTRRRTHQGVGRHYRSRWCRQAAPGTVIDDDLGIACGQGVLRPTILQRPGRGPVERRAFLNGTPVVRQRLLPCPATS